MRKVKELNPVDKMKLESSRGLVKRGQLPTVDQYNEAVKSGKQIGSFIDDYYLRK